MTQVARPETDDRLMERVQGDDPEAFGQLYDRHATHAFAVAQSVCHDVGLAEDAVQEGFLSIWRGRATYRPGLDSSFCGWAMQIVRHRAIDSRRRLRSIKRPPTTELLDNDVPEATTGTTHDDLVDDDEGDQLRALLDRLPESQAEVITLAFFGQLSHSEIAAELDLPSGTVKGRMRLGMEKLRRGMDVTDGEV